MNIRRHADARGRRAPAAQRTGRFSADWAGADGLARVAGQSGGLPDAAVEQQSASTTGTACLS
ncbi:hypothetical protein M885DRAFT_516962 [Pelagophyceae sp. CCMP2097]|nr:hypothetical protein M885DRAFT_516962 [Pelagophyceae sp. CCMP2097]